MVKLKGRGWKMSRHVFVAKRMGWDEERDGIWFDSDYYTKEEAEAQFEPVEKVTFKNDRAAPYTAYEYDGVTYHDYHYLGEYGDDEDLPTACSTV